MNTDKDSSNRKSALYDWVSLYQTRILRMCYMLLRDCQHAEDATQETFLKAYQSYDALRNKSKAEAWLITIAINTCRAMHRSRRTKQNALPLSDAIENLSAQQFPMESVLLHVEVERLPYREREVILLYYYHGMNVNDIARVLKISQSSVSSRLKKAEKQLRTVLKGDEKSESEG